MARKRASVSDLGCPPGADPCVTVSNTPLPPLPPFDPCAYGLCTPGFYNPVGEPSFPTPVLTGPLLPAPLAQPTPRPGPTPPVREVGQPPTPAPPPTDALPPVTVSAAPLAALGAFDPYGVTSTVASEESAFAQLIRGDFVPKLTSTFEELLAKKPLTTFEQLLQKPLKLFDPFAPPPVNPITAYTETLLSRLLGSISAGLGLLLYTSEAGVADEPQRVAAFLTAAGIPAVPGLPTTAAPGPSDTGLPVAPLGSGAETAPLPEVTVSAPRAPAALPLAQFLPGSSYSLGNLPLPEVAPLAVPNPRAAPQPARQPKPLQQPFPLTLPQPQPKPRLGVLASPEAMPTPAEIAQLSRATCSCTQPKDQKKKKKRKPRNVCYRGVYEDRANGLVKLKRERIPCR